MFYKGKEETTPDGQSVRVLVLAPNKEEANLIIRKLNISDLEPEVIYYNEAEKLLALEPENCKIYLKENVYTRSIPRPLKKKQADEVKAKIKKEIEHSGALTMRFTI